MDWRGWKRDRGRWKRHGRCCRGRRRGWCDRRILRSRLLGNIGELTALSRGEEGLVMGDVGGELQDGLGDAPSLQDQRGGACVGVEGDEGHDLLQGQREVLGEAVLVGSAMVSSASAALRISDSMISEGG